MILNDKFAVWSMLKHIFRNLKEDHSIAHIKVFSDGCAAQFKNRFTIMNICFMTEDFCVSGEWAFFASSHGKSSVDAVGGTVKRSVWREVKARKLIVNDANAFYEEASKICTGIKILYLSSEELRSESKFLESRWEGAIPIATIQKQHISQKAGPSHLYVARYAIQQPRPKVPIVTCIEKEEMNESENETIHPLAIRLDLYGPGDWVIVKYDQSTYPGEVKEVGEEEIKVTVMIPSGSSYKWPKLKILSSTHSKMC